MKSLEARSFVEGSIPRAVSARPILYLTIVHACNVTLMHVCHPIHVQSYRHGWIRVMHGNRKQAAGLDHSACKKEYKTCDIQKRKI